MTDDLSRLSPYNIEDDLLRTELYREIRAGADDWTQYTVLPDEILMPELVAYRHYGSRDLKWVILIAAGLDDMRGVLEAGTVLSLPTLPWIRQRIRYYKTR